MKRRRYPSFPPEPLPYPSRGKAPGPRQRLAAAAEWTRRHESFSQVLETLVERGLSVMAWKGLDSALSLYPEPWMRPMSDIDLLVPAEGTEALITAFEDNGWSVAPDRYLFDSGLVSQLKLTRWDLLVEIHTHVIYYPRILPHALPVRLFDGERPRTLTPGLLAPGWVSAMVLSLLHQCQQTFSRWYWWVDLALLSRKLTERSLWPEAVASAAGTGMAGSMSALLDVVAGMPEARVPAWVPGMLAGRADRRSERIMAAIRRGGGRPTLLCVLGTGAGSGSGLIFHKLARLVLTGRTR